MDSSGTPLSPATSPEARRHSWVPIRSLAERHRGRIAAHLLALEEGDRYLRFGYPATDAQIQRYVGSLDFARDELFGIFNRRLEHRLAHLAYLPARRGSAAPWPPRIGVSVLKPPGPVTGEDVRDAYCTPATGAANPFIHA